MKIAIVLAAFTILCSTSACSHTQTIPDPSVPHQVAKEAEVEIWVRRPDGTLSREKVRLLKGWWIAGPPVVEPEPVR